MVYCNNRCTITQATKYAAFNKIYPNQTISDDHDVYNEITHAIAELSEFHITFLHVKGYQNKNTSKKPLTLPAQLNIECNE